MILKKTSHILKLAAQCLIKAKVYHNEGLKNVDEVVPSIIIF